jgi:hypothetical protein
MNGTVLRSELDGTDWYYGVELQYRVNAHWALGLGWQQLKPEPNTINNLQATISYRF